MSPAAGYDLLIGVCLAAAIVVFFWSLDTVRRERVATDLVISPLPRRRPRVDVRDAVDRVMQPIADILSERNRRAGKITLAEELAKAGLRLTSSEYSGCSASGRSSCSSAGRGSSPPISGCGASRGNGCAPSTTSWAT